MDDRYRTAMSELDELKKDRFRNIRTYHSSFDQKYYSLRETGSDKKESVAMNKYEDTLNKMLLYYEHQLPTFISNVITQVIERHLIDGMEEIFEGERIHRLPDNVVKQIMEEDYATANERKELKNQRDVLQNGLDICYEIARRPDLGPYQYQDPQLRDPVIPRATRAMSPVPRREVPHSTSTYLNTEDLSSSALPRSNRSSGYGAPSTTNNHYGLPGSYDPSSYQNDPPRYDPPVIPGSSAAAAQDAANMRTPTSAEEEDEDLKRALEESAREAARSQLPPRPQAVQSAPSEDAASVASARRGGGRKGFSVFGRT